MEKPKIPESGFLPPHNKPSTAVQSDAIPLLAPVQPMPSRQVVLVAFGPKTQTVNCPHCHRPVNTRVEEEPSMMTHILALLLCAVWCCCVPYFIKSCQSRNHYCPSCGSFLGAFKN